MQKSYLAALFVLATTPAFGQTSADWYPISITPPSGHQYPCALTALPKDLSGIPDADKKYINHIYAMILKCLQAKLVIIDTINQDGQNYSQAYSQYYRDTVAARQKLLAEPVPDGLTPFRNTVVSAIDKQISYFGTAVKTRQAGGTAASALSAPAGREASSLLQNAWGTMMNRYPAMSPAVKDSTYHHLCALDVY